jgi:predicted amidophosphoribosyltransferase
VTVLDDDDLESMISARRKTRKEKSAGFCPKCGKPVQVSDRFCPSCGKAIN